MQFWSEMRLVLTSVSLYLGSNRHGGVLPLAANISSGHRMTHWEEEVRGETTPVTISSRLSFNLAPPGPELTLPFLSRVDNVQVWHGCNTGYEIPSNTRVCCQQKAREALNSEICPKDEGGIETNTSNLSHRFRNQSRKLKMGTTDLIPLSM